MARRANGLVGASHIVRGQLLNSFVVAVLIVVVVCVRARVCGGGSDVCLYVWIEEAMSFVCTCRAAS